MVGLTSTAMGDLAGISGDESFLFLFHFFSYITQAAAYTHLHLESTTVEVAYVDQPHAWNIWVPDAARNGR